MVKRSQMMEVGVSFDYFIARVGAADFSETPFRHIYLDDFFSEEDFAKVTGASEIRLPAAVDDGDLFDKLFSHGYKIIDFPGCVTDRNEYIRCHKNRGVSRRINTACEDYGMTLRLMKLQTPFIFELHEFLIGDKFRNALAVKFGIDLEQVTPDSGI